MTILTYDSNNNENDINISVIIPAYNEEMRLPLTLVDAISFFTNQKLNYEVIVIDDGSSDDTVKVVQKFHNLHPNVFCISLDKNYGKGYAVKRGVLKASGSLILMADADGATPFEEFLRLKSAYEDKIKANYPAIIIGSRAITSSQTEVKTALYRKLIGRVFALLVNLFLIPKVKDTQCGFKLFNRLSANYLFNKMTLNRFGFDIELLYLALRSEIQIIEVPINWRNVAGSKVNLVSDSLSMFLDIFRIYKKHKNISKDDYLAYLTTHRPSKESPLQQLRG